MPYVPFHEYFPDVAKQETRTVTITPAAKLGLPAGDYCFIELYCNEQDCDCRRVMFSVHSPSQRDVEAVIAWGWESGAFYRKWLGMDDPVTIQEMQGPILNLGSPQSKHATALLELARSVLLVDPAYVERIKRHYALFRIKIDGEGKEAKSARKKHSHRKGRRPPRSWQRKG